MTAWGRGHAFGAVYRPLQGGLVVVQVVPWKNPFTGDLHAVGAALPGADA